MTVMEVHTPTHAPASSKWGRAAACFHAAVQADPTLVNDFLAAVVSSPATEAGGGEILGRARTGEFGDAAFTERYGVGLAQELKTRYGG